MMKVDNEIAKGSGSSPKNLKQESNLKEIDHFEGENVGT